MDPTASKPACPQCGSTGDFAQRDIIPGLALFLPVVRPDGTIERQWTGDTQVDWDGQRPASHPPEIVCLTCDHIFTDFA